jgi:hypothetical protein
MPKNRNKIINLSDVKKIVKNNLLFGIQYTDGNNYYQDILHYSEIFIGQNKDVMNSITKVVVLDSANNPIQAVCGADAVRLLNKLSDFNEKKKS